MKPGMSVPFPRTVVLKLADTDTQGETDMNETKMNEETLTNAERAEQQVKMSFGPNAKHEILTTKSGISYNLTVILETTELAEKAIRGLVEAMDLQEEGFIEKLEELKLDAQRRNKKMKEYKETLDICVKETCKEKTLRTRAEKRIQVLETTVDEDLKRFTQRKNRIQVLENARRVDYDSYRDLEERFEDTADELNNLRRQIELYGLNKPSEGTEVK
jgi:hypothetical protein